MTNHTEQDALEALDTLEQSFIGKPVGVHVTRAVVLEAFIDIRAALTAAAPARRCQWVLTLCDPLKGDDNICEVHADVYDPVETAAPATTESGCKCGHEIWVHQEGTADVIGCLYVYDLGRMSTCGCTEFQPAESGGEHD